MTITINKIESPYVDRTKATIFGHLTLVNTSDEWEEWPDEDDITIYNGNKKLSSTTEFDYYGNDDSDALYFETTITGLSPGTKYNLTFRCDFVYVEIYYDKYYWFEYDGDQYGPTTNKTRAGEKYVEYLEEGCEMYPTEENEDEPNVITGRSNGTRYYLVVDEVEGEEYTDDYETRNFTLYTRPSIYHFKGDGTAPAKGDRWKISDGIQKELFTNIYNFNSAATAWKQWQNQGSETACDVFNQGTRLSATMMNRAYSYLGVELGEQSYQPGDKVSAAMFAGLENLLND